MSYNKTNQTVIFTSFSFLDMYKNAVAQNFTHQSNKQPLNQTFKLFMPTNNANLKPGCYLQNTWFLLSLGITVKVKKSLNHASLC